MPSVDEIVEKNRSVVAEMPAPFIRPCAPLMNRLVSGGICATPGKRLWATWLQEGESNYSYGIASFSDDDGETWNGGVFRTPQNYGSDGICTTSITSNLWTAPDGRLFWIYDYGRGHFDGIGGVWIAVCDNPDSPKPVWKTPVRIADGSAINNPVVLANGDWLLPFTVWTYPDLIEDRRFPVCCDPDFDDRRGVRFLISRDKGKHWNETGGLVMVAKELWNFYEPNVLECGDGTLTMYFRMVGGIACCHSRDVGISWSEPVNSGIEHPCSRIYTEKLRSGRWLMVRHDINPEVPLGRANLTAFLSEDEGKTWPYKLQLDSRRGISYPSGFQHADGRIFVAYDYARSNGEFIFATFCEEDVLAGKDTSGKCRFQKVIQRLPGYRADDTPENIRLLMMANQELDLQADQQKA